MVATDGHLDPGAVVRFVAPLAGTDSVTVLTVVEVPRQLISELRRAFGAEAPPDVDQDAEYVGVSGEGTGPVGWPGDDAFLDRYLDDQGEARTAPLAAALTDAGLEASVKVVDSEDPAGAIIDAVAEMGPDILCIGATGRGLFRGLVGSAGTKLMRLAECPVLLIR